MDATLTTNPAYNVLAFNGRKQLAEIHRHLSDFLHYQSHIRLNAATALLPGTLHANHRKHDAIITIIKEERLRLQTLKQLIDCINTNDGEILELYEESKIVHAQDWGALAWGPLPDWEQPQPLNPPPAGEE